MGVWRNELDCLQIVVGVIKRYSRIGVYSMCEVKTKDKVCKPLILSLTVIRCECLIEIMNMKFLL